MDPVFTPEDVYRSYQTRDVDFEDDDGHTTLGQKNHGNDTRTKITHRGGLGFGIIGTVLGVQYGKWGDDKPAMLLLMRFHFRSSDNLLRLRRAEISVRFDSRKAAVHPELQDLRQFYPKRRELVPDGYEGDFKITGQPWSSKDRKGKNEVFWTITATRKTDSALPNVLDLAAVVEYHGPFQGMVKVDAKSLHGSRYCQAPWSTDDPLIFDGMTPKGRLAVKGDFATLTEEDWLQYFCETSPTSSTISGKIDSSTSRPATSHESSRYARPATLDEFHVAVICALRDEQTAVEACFDEFWDAEKSYPKAAGDTNSYTLGRIGSHNVVLAHMSNMGNSSAASVAASLKITFQRIRFALVVGICGGVPRPSKSFKPEIWLGDVVISTGVVQYDLGWREPTKFKRRDTLESNLGRPPTDIRNILMSIEDGRNYSNLRERLWDQLPSLWQTQKTRYPFRYPGLDEDKLFKASYPHRHRGELSKCMQCKDGQNEACEKSKLSSCAEVGCDLAMLAPRSHSGREKVQNSTIQAGFRGDMLKPAVHFGIIASGNQVMKSGEDRDAIAKDTDAIAFEMEGAGVWDHFPCVVIKGVCDYSDSHKNYDWQIYSALTAASCMKAFLHEWSRQNPDGTM